MRDVLVVGIGDSDDGDGRVGFEVVRRLRAQDVPCIDTRCMGWDQANLLEIWEGYERVYLVDALHAGGPPGSIFRFDGHTDIIPDYFGVDASHSFQLRRAIELSRALNAMPDQLTLFGVEVARCFKGSGLSSPVEASADRLSQRIVAEIRRHPSDKASSQTESDGGTT